MTTELATRELPPDRELPAQEALRGIERVVIEGDLANLKPEVRVAYIGRVAESLGLNPLTRPFEFIRLNGKLTLYVKRDATDQLRKLHKVSIDRLIRERTDDLYIVEAHGHLPDGRTDQALGAVPIKGLVGDALANAMMKAETKAKRRLTLSLVGLGWLDESELAGTGAQTVVVDPVTGEMEEAADAAASDSVTAARNLIRQRARELAGQSSESDGGGSDAAGSEPEEVPVAAPPTSSGGSPSEEEPVEGEYAEEQSAPAPEAVEPGDPEPPEELGPVPFR